MTYSVIGRCPRTNQIGLGIATYSIACGSFAQGAHNPFGISMTQANVRKINSRIAANLMEGGLSAKTIISALVDDDEFESLRQIVVMTRDGGVAAHTGASVQPWAGEKSGANHIVFGNVLAGEHVLNAMQEGFCEDSELPLVERLIRSLEFGRDAGGQGFRMPKLPERSASVVVVDERSYADWDLRVDLHKTAVEELRRLYEVFKKYHQYYNDRDKDPSKCLSQLNWEKSNLTEDQLEGFLV